MHACERENGMFRKDVEPDVVTFITIHALPLKHKQTEETFWRLKN